MRVNTRESGLNQTVAVGMYPQGASTVGAMDMIGNVWEWCLNEYERSGNVGTSSDAPRVARGGSFAQVIARLTFRIDKEPNYRFDDFIGFRVVYGSERI
jgi:formylglycine-generating enzyme required for sulfatase activity